MGNNYPICIMLVTGFMPFLSIGFTNHKNPISIIKTRYYCLALADIGNSFNKVI